jgi:hypothetical protein
MKTLLLAAAAFVFAPSIHAGEFDPRSVSCEAAWVVHLDLEAMARSKFLLALREAGQEFANEFDFDLIESRFGVDPYEELSSITFYAPKSGDAAAVAVVRGSTRASSSWSRLIEAGRFVRKVAEHDVFSIGGGSARSFGCALPEAGGARTFVLAANERALGPALAVFDGKARSLADARDGKLDVRATTGAMCWASGALSTDRSVFTAGAMRLIAEIADLDPSRSRTIAESAKTLFFEIGEEGPSLFARLETTSSTGEAASTVGEILRDVVTKLRNTIGDSSASTRIERLLAPLRIEATGPRMRATYRYDARAFVDEVLRVEKELAIR